VIAELSCLWSGLIQIQCFPFFDASLAMAGMGSDRLTKGADAVSKPDLMKDLLLFMIK
jgi:hypothetical protein